MVKNQILVGFLYVVKIFQFQRSEICDCIWLPILAIELHLLNRITATLIFRRRNIPII